MKRQWTEAELDTHWALTAQEEALLVDRQGLSIGLAIEIDFANPQFSYH